MLAESGERVRRQASDAYQQASTNVNDVMNRGRAAVARGREAFISARERAVDEVPRRVESAVSESGRSSRRRCPGRPRRAACPTLGRRHPAPAPPCQGLAA